MTCPNGHASEAADFCDTCGAKIDPAAQPPAAEVQAPAAGAEAAEAAGQTCPNCHAVSAPDSLFCEACGYDFTTGAMPRGAVAPAADPAAPAPAAETGAGPLPTPHAPGIPPPVPLHWVAEVWVDPEWYAVQDAEEPIPSPGLPTVVPLTIRSALIGRVSASKNIIPDVDCTSDSGVSRRHAQLTTDGTRWFVEDLGSSNGTFIGDAGGSLPEDPIPVGQKRELQDDDRIFVGAWTRIVVREATEDEKTAATA
ncbi:MAG: FHA domain-containing protein [Dermatophilaceae bacterium]